MSPGADSRAHAGAGFVDHDVEAALEEVRCGGKADGAGTDDRDGESGEAVVGSAGRCNTTVNWSVADGIEAGPPCPRGAVLGAIETGSRTHGGL
ncbi:hypothetical protein GCM10017714_19800 [Curtobacterium pusillum]